MTNLLWNITDLLLIDILLLFIPLGNDFTSLSKPIRAGCVQKSTKKPAILAGNIRFEYGDRQ